MAYEKMNCLYESVEDLRARLGSTICRYQGKPVWVTVEAKTRLNLYDITMLELLWTIHPSDPDFDISSPEIGYVNYKNKIENKNTVVYLSRFPYRKYRQGLSSDVIKAVSTDKTVMNQQSVLTSPGMEESLLGVYPSLETSLSLISHFNPGSLKEIAISQEVALARSNSGMVSVLFREKEIGWVTPGERTISVARSPDDWLYKRVLKRYING